MSIQYETAREREKFREKSVDPILTKYDEVYKELSKTHAGQMFLTGVGGTMTLSGIALLYSGRNQTYKNIQSEEASLAKEVFGENIRPTDKNIYDQIQKFKDKSAIVTFQDTHNKDYKGPSMAETTNAIEELNRKIPSTKGAFTKKHKSLLEQALREAGVPKETIELTLKEYGKSKLPHGAERRKTVLKTLGCPEPIINEIEGKLSKDKELKTLEERLTAYESELEKWKEHSKTPGFTDLGKFKFTSEQIDRYRILMESGGPIIENPDGTRTFQNIENKAEWVITGEDKPYNPEEKPLTPRDKLLTPEEKLLIERLKKPLNDIYNKARKVDVLFELNDLKRTGDINRFNQRYQSEPMFREAAKPYIENINTKNEQLKSKMSGKVETTTGNLNLSSTDINKGKVKRGVGTALSVTGGPLLVYGLWNNTKQVEMPDKDISQQINDTLKPLFDALDKEQTIDSYPIEIRRDILRKALTHLSENSSDAKIIQELLQSEDCSYAATLIASGELKLAEKTDDAQRNQYVDIANQRLIDHVDNEYYSRVEAFIQEEYSHETSDALEAIGITSILNTLQKSQNEGSQITTNENQKSLGGALANNSKPYEESSEKTEYSSQNMDTRNA